MNVTIITSSISRQAGGLFESVRNLAIETIKANNCVNVHGLRDMYSREDKNAWLPIKPVLHEITGPDIFGYAPDLSRAIRESKPDIIHQHGLWMYPSFAISKSAIQGVRTIISPRGMLSEWALNNSRFKKKMAYHLFERKNLVRARCIHALCESEFEDIRRIGIKGPICIIPNGVSLSEEVTNVPPLSWEERVTKTKKLLFLGRIHPKKGIFELVDAWVKCPETEKNGWSLIIAGWGADHHEKSLRKRIETLCCDNSIHFIGAQYGSDKLACLKKADAFILPSHSEGLPMAVLEAWSHSLPVLLTPQSNLEAGFKSKCAIKIEPREESILEGLIKLFSLTDDEMRKYGSRGRALVESRYLWPLVAEQMCEVYEWLLGYRSRPDCVIES